MEEIPATTSPRWPIRLQFAHGLEGSPQGAKARLFARHFEAVTPPMDTSNFEGCVSLHYRTLEAFQPDVLVGSSFGGAVALALLQRGHWRGPTLLLAQAALRLGLAPEVPSGVHVWLVHGHRDALIPIEDSRRLAERRTPGLVRLIEVDDDHRLGELVASGALVEIVRALVATARGAPGVAGPPLPAPGRWDPTRDGPLCEATLRRKLEGLGYRVARYVYPPGTAFPPHTHAADKLDAVVSGRFRLVIGGIPLLLGPGEWVAVPRDTVHSAAVVGHQAVVSLDATRVEDRSPR